MYPETILKPSREKLHNLILLGLPAKESDVVRKNLEFIKLPTHFVLHEAGEPIKFVYFIESGLASVLTMMVDGKSVEVGLAGQGRIHRPSTCSWVEHECYARHHAGEKAPLTVSKQRVFHGFYPPAQCSEKILSRYSLALGMQAVHVAACNRLHEVDERLARWLLMSQDRLGGDVVPLTQEFLAHMLGTRRASVTVAAGILQKAGLITYNRGHVSIENRERLEDAACECYAAMKKQSMMWEQEANRLGTLPR